MTNGDGPPGAGAGAGAGVGVGVTATGAVFLSHAVKAMADAARHALTSNAREGMKAEASMFMTKNCVEEQPAL